MARYPQSGLQSVILTKTHCVTLTPILTNSNICQVLARNTSHSSERTVYPEINTILPEVEGISISNKWPAQSVRCFKGTFIYFVTLIGQAVDQKPRNQQHTT